MPKLHYISYARFPTEKAHGLQIAQNCEALADAGYAVTLWVSARKNTPDMDTIDDIHAHYGVAHNFEIRRIASLDGYALARGNTRVEYLAFWVHVITYCLMLLVQIRRDRADVYYSRDPYALLALSWIVPREQLAFEVHQFAPTRKGQQAQGIVMRRVGHTIAITPRLRQDCIAHYELDPQSILVAHDGIRQARFADMPDQSEARTRVGWSHGAFIVGYMGRLHTMGMDKGVGLLVDAVAQLEGVTLALVGGPDDMAEQLAQRWRDQGGDPAHFLNVGTVAPREIPPHLSAFDVCAMPFPWTDHYAHYMSPLKLFEYMASGKAILATDLPSVVDVVQHGETAYIVPPDDVQALRDGIHALQSDASLRAKLGENARQRVLAEYTWSARADHIRAHLERYTGVQ
ncbi:MAG: glycosyltransferase family 4 protein [Anaerolineae bacterium]